MPLTSAQKFASLPPDIQDILMADVDFELNLEIGEKYGISGTDMVKVSGITADLLWQKLSLAKLPEIIAKTFGFDQFRSKEMAVDFVGKRLLVLDDYFKGEPSRLLGEWGAKAEDFQSDVYRQKKVISQARKDREQEKAAEKAEAEKAEKARAQAAAEAIKNIKIAESNDEEELKDAPEIFSHSLVDFFTAESAELKELIDDYNGVLLLLLQKNPNFKKSLEEALYANQEILTEKSLTIDGKAVEPTIANWLADFIAQNGSNFFDNLALSQYLSKSKNARNLPVAERQLVTKLLLLYRTLKFFPNSLAGVAPENWELIPIDRAPEEEPAVAQSAAARPVKEKPVAAQPEPAGLTEIERKALAEWQKNKK